MRQAGIRRRGLRVFRSQYMAEEWLPSESGLGESPLYRQENDTFFFVDIRNCRVHCMPLARSWEGR